MREVRIPQGVQLPGEASARPRTNPACYEGLWRRKWRSDPLRTEKLRFLAQ
jgi:hypothetical protein